MGQIINGCLTGSTNAMPGWVPRNALHYIAHTEMGRPIRALARAADCHASTVLRQIRKLEMRRDDPLVDGALRKLGAASGNLMQMGRLAVKGQAAQAGIPDDDTLAREAMRVLRRLCESGAVLAVASDLEKAVVVRDVAGGGNARIAVVDTSVAQAMALNDWISPLKSGRITRYRITTNGRNALANYFSRYSPLQDDQPDHWNAPVSDSNLVDLETEAGRPRTSQGEHPLIALSRRRDRSGKPFLSESLVQAGEQLREDFELAGLDCNAAVDWDSFLMAPFQSGVIPARHGSDPATARDRVKSALQSLGPGLSDLALRCCCYLEGLETTEKALGWSARSGKVVLRIALVRLKRHYDESLGPGGALIG